MQTILITGAKGFIGKNLVQQLSLNSCFNLLLFDKENTLTELSGYVKEADFIYHLAGVNRPESSIDFETHNVDLTRSLLSYLRYHKKNIPLVISSSIQALSDTPYGHSKRQMERFVEGYFNETKFPTFIYRLPNVFGKWCRPHYNSVVATFCHNLAHQLPVHIHEPHKTLTLVYIDDLVADFMNLLETLPRAEELYLSPSITYDITLQILSDKLEAFKANRKSLHMPNLTSNLDQALYATYLSYLEPTTLSYEPPVFSDHRGSLSELMKSSAFGQCFISYTKPQVTRGNHYHHTKTEKFIVLQGEALIKLRQIHSKDVLHYHVSGTNLTIVDIPVGYTHSITNTGSTDLITLFWSSQIFDSHLPDTYFEEV